MKPDAEPTSVALTLVERGVTRLAAATLALARSQAWNDLLGTIDRLAALLGTDVGPASEPESVEVDPAQVGRFVAGWVQILVLPEYLEHGGPGRARYRVRLPAEARADGLGDLADFLESLGLRLDLAVDGEVVRLSMAVGGGDRSALSASCAADRLELDLDLGATRGALRHMATLVDRLPAARTAAPGLELDELSGTFRLRFSAGDGRMRLAVAVHEALRIVGRTDDGPMRIEVDACELLAIEGDAGGTLEARVEVGAVRAQVPASMIEEGKAGTVEYDIAAAGGGLHATRGDRALKLRRLTLGSRPAVARRGGIPLASVEILGPGADLDLEPLEPGRFVLAPESDLSFRLGPAGQEVAVSVPAGSRLELVPEGLRVQKGRIVLGGAGATAELEVAQGRALVRRKEPRPGEGHPLLRFYESRTS